MTSQQIPQTEVFGIDDAEEWMALFDKEKTLKNNKKIEYYNTPVAFDIETTSFHAGRRKAAIMYVWTLSARFKIIQGRTWGEFVELMRALSSRLGLGADRRIIIYVHNLGFEFQFIRKYFDWVKVFAIAPREPLVAITDGGLEFRCSYKLTNYSLETVANNLVNWNIKKLAGNLDYTQIRHAGTPLTPAELQYTYNDVIILNCLIDDLIKQAGGNITYIPLTATGYARKYCRNACLKQGKGRNWRYFNLVSRLRLTPDQYKYLKQAFQGGFTHANAWHVEHIMHDIGSADLISSYPACLVRERFPMSPPEEIKTISTIQELEKNLSLYCCFFQIEFENLRATRLNEHYISVSKCYNTEYVQEDNGRVVNASRVQMTITEQDYFIIKKFYDWDKIRLGRFWRMRKDYLPRELIDAILDLYGKKTELKGVAGKEIEYQHSKELLNAAGYGMMVTAICRTILEYDNATKKWLDPREPDLEEEIKKYNESWGRFLYYPWGIWIAAYARRVLFGAIDYLGDDYIYSDTDAVYFRNPAKHIHYFEAYNARNYTRLLEMSRARNIAPDKLTPKTIAGKSKTIGNWEPETDTDADGNIIYNVYSRFKTLGAKRYMYERNGKINLTVSGVNKKTAMPYLLKRYWPMRIFSHFREFLKIPGKYTGKQTHFYVDYKTEGTLTDYKGNKQEYSAESGIFIEDCEYFFSVARKFRQYLDGINNYNMLGGL